MKLMRGRNIRVLFTLLFLCVLVVIAAKITNADTWSWTGSADPSISWQDEPLGQANGDDCHQEDNIVISGTASPTSACIDEGQNVRFGIAGGGNDIVSFNSDANYYPISGTNSNFSYVGTTLIPHTDTALYRQDWVGYGLSLSIYKDFASRPTKTDTGYVWNRSNPSFVLKDDAGNDIKVRAVGYSDNGDWVAAEMPTRGIVLIDVLHGQAKIISKYKGAYGKGQDPTMALGVSDDGQHIALAGLNVDLRIIDATNNCGDNPTASSVDASSLVNPCPERELGSQVSSTVPDAGNGFTDNPRFSYDGAQLFVNTSDANTHTRVVTLNAGGYIPPKPLDYLALGDSFSSGEGDIDDRLVNGKRYYLPGTDVNGDYPRAPEEKCHVSSRSYPFVLASAMQLPAGQVQSIACSGAVMSDVDGTSPNVVVYNQQPTFAGQNNLQNSPRLAGLSQISDKIVGLDSDALNNIIPGRVQQIDFVKKYQPKSLTLTISGNDVEFGDIMKSCASGDDALFTCDWAEHHSGAGPSLENLGNVIKGQYGKITQTLQNLKAASPNTRIYILGYPQFVNADPNTATCFRQINLNLTERLMIANGVSYLNQVIKAAAGAAGVNYIDTENSIDSARRLCGALDPADGNVNGLIAGAYYASGNNIYDFQEMYHPNAKGQKAIATTISNALNGSTLDTFNDCTSQIIICSSSNNESEPAVPGFFNSPITAAINAPANFINSNEESLFNGVVPLVKGVVQHVASSVYTVSKDSAVSVKIHSDVVDLGNIQAGDDGSLNGTITIPTSLPAGMHTITFEGQSYSGEPIVYYQTVLVEGSNPNDVDENGIPDAQQACGPFIAAANSDVNNNGIDDACDPSQTAVPTNLQATSPTYTDPNLTWTGTAYATNYEVYRDGTSIDMTTSTSYVDPSAPDGSHTYFVTAIEGGIQGNPSSKLNVIVNRVPPAPKNLTGPNPSQSAVLTWGAVSGANSYNIYRDGSKIATSQTTSYTDVSAGEGSHNYTVTTIRNNRESVQSSSVAILIDRTPPVVTGMNIVAPLTIPIFGLNIIALQGNTKANLSASTSDTGSGVSNGEYYIDTDPGKGHGITMNYLNGKITISIAVNSIPPGYHTIYARSKDKAGNWSNTVSVTVLRIL